MSVQLTGEGSPFLKSVGALFNRIHPRSVDIAPDTDMRDSDAKARVREGRTKDESQWRAVIEKDLNAHVGERTKVEEKETLINASVDPILELLSTADETQQPVILQTLKTLFARDSAPIPGDQQTTDLLDDYLRIGTQNYVSKENGAYSLNNLKDMKDVNVSPMVLLAYVKEAESRFQKQQKEEARRKEKMSQIQLREQMKGNRRESFHEPTLEETKGLALNAFNLLEPSDKQHVHTLLYKFVNQPPHQLHFDELPPMETSVLKTHLRNYLREFAKDHSEMTVTTEAAVFNIENVDLEQKLARFLNGIDSEIRISDSFLARHVREKRKRN